MNLTQEQRRSIVLAGTRLERIRRVRAYHRLGRLTRDELKALVRQMIVNDVACLLDGVPPLVISFRAVAQFNDGPCDAWSVS